MGGAAAHRDVRAGRQGGRAAGRQGGRAGDGLAVPLWQARECKDGGGALPVQGWEAGPAGLRFPIDAGRSLIDGPA